MTKRLDDRDVIFNKIVKTLMKELKMDRFEAMKLAIKILDDYEVKHV